MKDFIEEVFEAIRAWCLDRRLAHARAFHEVLVREHRAEEARSARAIAEAEREVGAWTQERAVRRVARRRRAAL